MIDSQNILVIEDEEEIRQLIRLHLHRDGFLVDEVSSGEQAMEAIRSKKFSLIILDWMLPGLSGLEITQWIRMDEANDLTPILFVTAKVEPEDIAIALNKGADDYITKPFDTMVLMARVNALLRRRSLLQKTENTKASGNKIKVGELELNPDSCEVFLAGEKMSLTKSEFRLLECLMENQGKVLSRELLIEQIQGEGVNVVGRTVDTHVFGLRKKMDRFADLIETIRGIGYRVRFPEDRSPRA